MKELIVENLCRLCLSNMFSFSDIFLDSSFSGRLIYEVIDFVYNMKISENDSMPRNICHPCLWKLLEFEAHKRNVLAAESELLGLIGRFENDSVVEESEPGEAIPVEEDQSLSENVVAQEKEVVEREGGMELMTYNEIPCCSTTRSKSFSKNCKVENIFPSEIQIEDVYSVGTSPEIPEIKRVHLDMLSDGLKADVNLEDRLQIFDTEMPILSPVISNIQEKSESQEGHVMFKSIPASKYKCAICEKAFMFKSSLSNHAATHSNRRIFPCIICGKCFKTNCYRMKHQRNHVKDNLGSKMKNKCKDKSIVCTNCGLTFLKRKKFEHHLRSHRTNFSCIVCNLEFVSKISLDLHLNNHLRMKQMSCRSCNKFWKNPAGFKKHVAQHSDAAPLPCKM